MNPYYEDGSCTIYHGDCREIDDWDIAGAFMVTDPPYGMAFSSARGGAFGQSEIQGDETWALRDEVLNRWAPRPALVFGRWSVVRPMFTRAVLTWDKGEHVGMGDLALPWKPNTEEVYVLGSGFQGRRDGSVLRCHAIAGTVGQRALGTRLHPTEKPLGLMLALVDKCAPLADIVDPFMGSGTTLVAAKSLRRGAIGIEIEERYCEIAARRLAQEVLAL